MQAWDGEGSAFGESVLTEARRRFDDEPGQSSSTLLTGLAGLSGIGPGGPSAWTGTQLFRAAELPPAADPFPRFVVLARPGEPLVVVAPELGDLLVRVGRGEGWSRIGVVGSAGLLTLDDLAQRGLRAEGAPESPPGSYVHVHEAGVGELGRRLLDAQGTVLPDTLLVRLLGPPREPGLETAETVAPADGDLRWVQSTLNSVANAGLQVDGQFGPRSLAALRSFQAGQGLPASGVLDPPTLAALREAAGGALTGAAIGGPTGAVCTGVPELQTLDRFAFGRAEVQPHHQRVIDNLAACILQSRGGTTPITTLTLIGHTDPVGTDADNDGLGRRRAQAVRDALMASLVRQGGSPAGLTVLVETRGEREQTGGGAAANRRVEIKAPFAYYGRRPPVIIPPGIVPTVVPAGPALNPPRWGPILSAAKGPMAELRTGNGVRHLIEAEHPTNPRLSGYRSMVEALTAARSPGTYVYLLGWSVDDDFEMISCNPDTKLKLLLQRASAGGAQIRAVFWRQTAVVGSMPLTQAAVRNIQGLRDGDAIIDSETLSLGSHHQKILVVRTPERLIGFIGGMDVFRDRIEPRGVTCNPPGLPSPQSGVRTASSGPLPIDSGESFSGGIGSSGDGAPQHDVHCRIVGPSAFDLLQTFIHRWDHHPDSRGIDARRGPLLGRAEPVPPPLTSPSAEDATTLDTCSVVVARTFNPVTPRYPFPRERDIRALLLAAIANAQRFIYMEDQYLFSAEAATALRAALPRIAHLTIVIPGSEITWASGCPWRFRREFIDRLTSGLRPDLAAKVRVFRLATPPNPPPPMVCGSTFRATYGPRTYVHAKTWCFDDELAVIGSANCNRRGWEHDSESNAFIFDDRAPAPGGFSFAQRTRMDLWERHLAVPAASMADGVASGALWLTPPRGASILTYCPRDHDDNSTTFCATIGRDISDPGAP